MQDTTRKTLSLSSPRPQRTRSATRPYAGTRPSVPEKPAPELTDVRADSLAYALSGAAQAIAAVLEGTALPQALTDIFTRLQATPQARGAIQDIAYRSMRQLGRTEALLQIMTSKKPEPVLLYGLLCASLTLLMREGDQELAYEPFVVVDQAVSAAASASAPLPAPPSPASSGSSSSSSAVVDCVAGFLEIGDHDFLGVGGGVVAG